MGGMTQTTVEHKVALSYFDTPEYWEAVHCEGTMCVENDQWYFQPRSLEVRPMFEVLEFDGSDCYICGSDWDFHMTMPEVCMHIEVTETMLDAWVIDGTAGLYSWNECPLGTEQHYEWARAAKDNVITIG